jgi:hypothetical protein
MPRPKKPAGYERWTWAEINAGRRFSKAERRWNHLARKGGWQQRSDGSFEAPAELKPLLVVLLAVMLIVGMLAPNGLQHSKGTGQEAVAALLLIVFCIFALIYFAVLSVASGTATRRNASAVSAARRRQDNEAVVVACSWLFRAVSHLVFSIPSTLVHVWTKTLPAVIAKVRALPEWVQATLLGLACAVPPVAFMIYLFHK